MARIGTRSRDLNLIVQFKDAAGEEITDLSRLTNINVDIFPPNTDTTDESQAIVVGASATSLGRGYYRYTYTIPADAEYGTWYDRWQGELDGNDLDYVFSFSVVGAGVIASSTPLYANNRITVTLSSSIENTDETSLGTDYTFYFTTEYSPLFASYRQVQLRAGTYLTSVPDDTINLAIWEASKEANTLTFVSSTSNSSYYEYARNQFVICRATQILLGNYLDKSGRISKKLGDFEIDMSAPGIQKMFDKMQECVDKFLPIVESRGAKYVEPEFVIKGELDADRPLVGRIWDNEYTSSPIATTKFLKSGYRRWKIG